MSITGILALTDSSSLDFMVESLHPLLVRKIPGTRSSDLHAFSSAVDNFECITSSRTLGDQRVLANGKGGLIWTAVVSRT